MTNEDVARILLSGEYSRRRGVYSRALVTWQQVAVTGTVAIWALLVRADSTVDLATGVALASALSSLLIGVWRLYSRILDNAIVAMYPMLYLCERVLVPGPACTFPTPKGIPPLTQEQAAGKLDWTTRVRTVDFGHRLHRGTDVIAWIVIGAFLVLSIHVGLQEGRFARVDATYVSLLCLTLAGAALVLVSWVIWRCKVHAWPTPVSKGSSEE